MHEVVIVVAKYFILLSALGALLVWFRLSLPEKKRFIFIAVLAAISSLLLAKIGSKLYIDPRPFVVGHFTPYFAHGADNGFPSDHTLLASFLAFTTWHFSRKAGIILLVIAILIGLSRVIAGVHHLVDVAGSIVFAFIGVWLADFIVDRFYKPQLAYGKQAREPEA